MNIPISVPSLFLIITTLLHLPLLILYLKAKLQRTVNLAPGRMGWPIIGETGEYVLSCKRGYLNKFLSDRMSRYSSDVFKTSLLGEKVAVFCSSTTNKFVFANENKLVQWWAPSTLFKILLPGCDYADQETIGEKLRATVSEFSKPDAVQRYIPTMDYIVKKHLDQEWAPNQTLTVYTVARKLMFSLSCLIFMGIEDTNQITKLSDQFEIVAAGLYSMPINLPGTKLRRAIKTANAMRSDLRKIIRREKLSRNKDSGSMNMLSYLLSATDSEGQLLSEEEIARMLLIILLASQHSTSSLITNLVYFLADNPSVYDTALNEQLEIKSLRGDEKELLSWKDTKRMKYGRNVVHEVLRIAPAFVAAFRNVLHDITVAGFTIPKGWKIFFSLNTMNKDPKYYPDPERFDPTRFIGKGPVPFTYTPFGGGPHLCPGNEFARQVALVFLHNLLIKFTWEKLIPTEKIIYANVSAVPANGLPIKLQPRHRELETQVS